MIISTDPIADMLSRIRNAISVNKREVEVPFSKMKQQIADRLKLSRYIDDYKITGEGIDKTIQLVIHNDAETARITKLVRLSTPGRRLYSQSRDIPIIKNGRGIVLISTSRGIMTGDQAKSLNLGGELICEVY